MNPKHAGCLTIVCFIILFVFLHVVISFTDVLESIGVSEDFSGSISAIVISLAAIGLIMLIYFFDESGNAPPHNQYKQERLEQLAKEDSPEARAKFMVEAGRIVDFKMYFRPLTKVHANDTRYRHHIGKEFPYSGTLDTSRAIKEIMMENGYVYQDYEVLSYRRIKTRYPDYCGEYPLGEEYLDLDFDRKKDFRKRASKYTKSGLLSFIEFEQMWKKLLAQVHTRDLAGYILFLVINDKSKISQKNAWLLSEMLIDKLDYYNIDYNNLIHSGATGKILYEGKRFQIKIWTQKNFPWILHHYDLLLEDKTAKSIYIDATEYYNLFEKTYVDYVIEERSKQTQ